MKANAAQDETGLDETDLSTIEIRDATHFRAVIAAAEAVDAAEKSLRDAVAGARAAGDSWTIIGAALGVTKQAAQQRFSR